MCSCPLIRFYPSLLSANTRFGPTFLYFFLSLSLSLSPPPASPPPPIRGKGCAALGRHTSKGGYILDRSKMLEIVVPDGLSTFKLKPYIASTVGKYRPMNKIAEEAK